MAIFRYGWHPWILVPTWCPPSIFTNFSLAKSHNYNFFIRQKSKGTCFQQMLNISVNFDFCIMKKLWDLVNEKLVNILGGHHVGTNIHGCWNQQTADYYAGHKEVQILHNVLFLHLKFKDEQKSKNISVLVLPNE